MSLLKRLIFIAAALLTVLLVACQPKTQVEVTPSAVVSEGLQTPQVTPTAAPQSLIVCLSEEPSSLYPYAENNASAREIMEAIYDGPIDTLDYRHQAVILAKIPSLSDGDVRVLQTSVSEGDLVFAENLIQELVPGLRIRPAGCTSPDCELIFEGGEILIDQMEVQFSLLPNLLWSDGMPLSADDSVFAYQLAQQTQPGAMRSLLERTASYEALDAVTLLWRAVPGVIENDPSRAFWLPLPAHYIAGIDVTTLSTSLESARNPLGWGPYRVQKWVPGSSILLEKNPFYHRAEQGLPNYEQLLFRFIGQEAQLAIDSVLSGECDLIPPSAELFTEAYRLAQLEAAGELQVIRSEQKAWEVLDIGIHPTSYDDGYSLYLGDRPDFFSDVRTRQAIAFCLNRQAVVDTLLGGASVVLNSYLSPAHPLYNANVQSYPYNPEQGKALLEEVGWVLEEGRIRVAQGVENIADGTPFEIQYLITRGVANQRQKAAEKFAADLSACGIKVNVEILSLEELYASAPEGLLFGRQYDLAQYPWQLSMTPSCSLYLSEGISGDRFATISEVPWLASALPEADPYSLAFPQSWGGWNTPAFASPNYDAACLSALQARPDSASYKDSHWLAQQLFSENLPVIPLYIPINLAIARADICHFMPNASEASALWNIEQIAFGEACNHQD